MNLTDIWQAAYTAGAVLPKPVSTTQYWHRSLNPKKLISVGFSRLQVQHQHSHPALMRVRSPGDHDGIWKWASTAVALSDSYQVSLGCYHQLIAGNWAELCTAWHGDTVHCCTVHSACVFECVLLPAASHDHGKDHQAIQAARQA